jgi:hypothetical protein
MFIISNKMLYMQFLCTFTITFHISSSKNSLFIAIKATGLGLQISHDCHVVLNSTKIIWNKVAYFSKIVYHKKIQATLMR